MSRIRSSEELPPPTAPPEALLRRELRAQPGHRFVNAGEFVRLLASRLDLERADLPRAGVRGVRDRRNGIRYLIEAERLGELGGPRAPAL
jgi:hypothetical protein